MGDVRPSRPPRWIPIAFALVVVALGVIGLLGAEPESDLPTFGGVELDRDGEVDVAGAPDLIAVVGTGEEVAGYARKADLFPDPIVTEGRPEDPVIPLFDERGEKLVAFLVPDHGVVSVGDYNRGDFGSTIPTVTTTGR